MPAAQKNLIRKTVSFRAHQDESLPTRTETFDGREYLVVPVIALVEGVLQAMNAPTPELALAEEFGKVPDSWNGRPIVMNHPVINNLPVSANSPAVLEKYQFGTIFNARIEDASLKVEAWLDIAKIEALGGEVAEVLERINNGELIEVSTGLFTATENVSGRFNGRDYKAIWRNIIPDHLAFLSEGVLGACSGEDGCGVRVNTQHGWGEFTMPATLELNNGPTEIVKPNNTASADDFKAASAELKIDAKTIAATDCGCDGKPVTISQLKDNASEAESVEAVFDEYRFMANSVPDGMVDQDVRKLLSQAIRSIKGYNSYGYIIYFTADKVIYEVYDSYQDYGYITYQRSYSIDEDGTVTFGGDTERVNLLTKVVPVTTPVTIVTNSGDPAMPDNAPNTPATTPASETTTTTTATAPTPAATEVAPTVATAAPKVRTMAEYIAEAPPEMQEMLQSGIRMHNEKKASVIKALKDSGRCEFDDAFLNAQNLETLEKMAKLSNVPTYEGVAPAVRDNAGGNDQSGFAPAMPALVVNNTNAA